MPMAPRAARERDEQRALGSVLVCASVCVSEPGSRFVGEGWGDVDGVVLFAKRVEDGLVCLAFGEERGEPSKAVVDPARRGHEA